MSVNGEARESAERWFPGAPLCQDAKLGYAEGFAEGFAEGIRRAREVASPDFSKGSRYRRENYVREEVAASIDALGEESDGSA